MCSTVVSFAVVHELGLAKLCTLSSLAALYLLALLPHTHVGPELMCRMSLCVCVMALTKKG